MLITARSFKPLSVFIATNLLWSIKLFSALPGCCPLHRMAFSNVVHMHTLTHTKDHGHWSGSETSAHVKLQVEYSWLANHKGTQRGRLGA